MTTYYMAFVINNDGVIRSEHPLTNADFSHESWEDKLKRLDGKPTSLSAEHRFYLVSMEVDDD